MRYWLFLSSSFLLCMIIYGYVWSNAPFLAPDSTTYMKVARDLSDLKIDRLHDRTLGYPILLLLTNSATDVNKTLFFTQMILHFLTISLFVLLLIRFGISKRLIFVFILISLTPPKVELAAYVLTESFTQFLLTSAIASLIIYIEKGGWPFVIVSGISFSFAAITRPTYQLLFIGICAILLLFIPFFPHLRRRLISGAATIFIVSSVVIGGLVLFNFQKFNFAGISPLAGFHLSTKTVRFVERLPDEYSKVREILIKYRDKRLVEPHQSHTGFQYIWYARKELQEKTKMTTPELSKYLIRLNLLLIRSAPLEYLSEVFRALSTYWFPFTSEVSNFNSRFIQFVWSGIHFLLIGLFMMISMLLINSAILLFILPLRIRKAFIKSIDNSDKNLLASKLLILCIILYTMVISILIEPGIHRHRTPTDLLIVCATLMGFELLSRFRRKFQSNLELEEQ